MFRYIEHFYDSQQSTKILFDRLSYIINRLLQKAIFVHFLTSSFSWHICHLFDTVQKTALVSYRKLIQFRSIPGIVDDQMMVPTM